MRIFARLLGFLAPYRKGVAWSFVLATAAIIATVAIPYLSGVVVDAIHNHQRHRLLGLALLVLAAGAIRLLVSAGRRLIAGRVSLGVEYDLRNLLFRQLQSLELAFFDQQQTGQLMSRASAAARTWRPRRARS